MKPELLGQTIAKARRQQGLSQEELAEAAELSVSTLSKLEQGSITNPSIWTVLSLAKALKLTMDELIATDTDQATKATPRPSGGLKMIVFDLHSTLLEGTSDIIGLTAQAHQLDPLQVEEIYLKYDSLICCDVMSVEKFNTVFADLFNLKQFDYYAHYLEANQPHAPLLKLLEEVRRQGYKTALMSDLYRPSYAKLEANGVVPALSDFDYHAFSYELGVMKPDPVYKEHLEAASGCRGNEIMLIDDISINVSEALEWNWQAIHYDQARATTQLHDLRQILGL